MLQVILSNTGRKLIDLNFQLNLINNACTMFILAAVCSQIFCQMVISAWNQRMGIPVVRKEKSCHCHSNGWRTDWFDLHSETDRLVRSMLKCLCSHLRCRWPSEWHRSSIKHVGRHKRKHIFTPVLLFASVSDNYGNSLQMSALRRSREIDQSTQRFHVGCDNLCRYKSRHPFDPGWYFELQSLDEMILILTNQAVFVTLSVVTNNDTSIGAGHLYFDAKSSWCNWGPIRCGDTKCLVLLSSVLPSLERYQY